MDTSDQIASENFNRFMRAMEVTAKISLKAAVGGKKQLDKTVEQWYQAINKSLKTKEENIQMLAVMRFKLETSLQKEVAAGNLKNAEYNQLKNVLDNNFANYSDKWDLAMKCAYMDVCANHMELDKSDIYQDFYDNLEQLKPFMDKEIDLPTKEELQREQYQEYEQSQEQNQQRDEQEQYNRENNAGGEQGTC